MGEQHMARNHGIANILSPINDTLL